MSLVTESTNPYFNDSPYTKALDARIVDVQGLLVLLDRTHFYPTGGGQPGDTGSLVASSGEKFAVVNTFRDDKNAELIWHQMEAFGSELAVGTEVTGHIDWNRRYRHMQMHTCLHLLCSLIDAPVTGCGIAEDKGRLDFDLQEPMDKLKVTEQLNHLIQRGIPVRNFNVQPENTKDFSNLVRTASVQPPVLQGVIRMIEVEGTDVQPCGGTHVSNTKEIGSIVCAKIQKKSKTNRRFTLRWENQSSDMA
ncbi:MAG: alanyl-tRNA editing protein [Marinobacter sp.]|nr:alanyl-tRNA editing protein [Marinobacter sp.]